jgi:hypothetical protein
VLQEIVSLDGVLSLGGVVAEGALEDVRVGVVLGVKVLPDVCDDIRAIGTVGTVEGFEPTGRSVEGPVFITDQAFASARGKNYEIRNQWKIFHLI